MATWGRREGAGFPWGIAAILGGIGGILLIIFLIMAIFVVRAGEVAVRFDPFGQYQVMDEANNRWVYSSVSPEEYDEGINIKAPWVSIDRYNVKTQDYTMSSILEEGEIEGPDAIKTVTSEGLYVTLDITVLYRVNQMKADEVRRNIGKEGDYQQIVVRPTIRSIIREVVSRYEAVDVYGEMRGIVESEIFDYIVLNLEPRGIVVERVLLRSVELPPQLTQAIEEKKQAEQDALRMEYVLIKEALEKDRKIIEAGGIARANEIISENLTTKYLQWYWINSLQYHDSVIYVPSEGGLPILVKDIDIPIPGQ